MVIIVAHLTELEGEFALSEQGRLEQEGEVQKKGMRLSDGKVMHHARPLQRVQRHCALQFAAGIYCMETAVGSCLHLNQHQ